VQYIAATDSQLSMRAIQWIEANTIESDVFTVSPSNIGCDSRRFVYWNMVDDHAQFAQLLLEWHKERGITSSITKMAMCPSYQKIIGMGEKAIHLILRQMENEGDEPDMWFWALRVLTNTDPVPEDARGNIVRMSQAWLNWARGRYVW
jgi:hypothetical protein